MIFRVLVVMLFFTLTGCMEKSFEEEVKSTCLHEIENVLPKVARYNGWDLSNAQTRLLDLKLSNRLNAEKSETDFKSYLYLVEVSGFSLKNRFNSDLMSNGTCSGSVVLEDKNGTLVNARGKDIYALVMRVTINDRNVSIVSQDVFEKERIYEKKLKDAQNRTLGDEGKRKEYQDKLEQISKEVGGKCKAVGHFIKTYAPNFVAGAELFWINNLKEANKISDEQFSVLYGSVMGHCN